MGCDIHWCVEVKTNQGWIGLLQSCGTRCSASDRYYAFFAELAGVRAYDDRDYPKPKGLPADISALTEYAIAATGSWDHSHSWCSLKEFVDAYNRTVHRDISSSDEELSAAALFGFDWWPLSDEAEVRVVFAFDN